jgi:hypothetical protein
MIESLKSAAAINATLYAKRGVEPGKDQGQAGAAPLRQPEPQMSEAATLSAAIQRLISERDMHKARAGTQETELTRLRAVNEELRSQREQTAALRDHYIAARHRNADHAQAYRRHDPRARAEGRRGQ